MVRDGSAAERRFEGRLRSLRSAGHRITAQRRAVLRALAMMGCACGAEDVHARARRIYPRLGLVTVYRTLAALVREGLAQTVQLDDGRVRYELRDDGRHHHHLVCLSCGSIARLEACALGRLQSAGLRRGFRVTAHRLELFGYCEDCQPSGGRHEAR
ncbi:MAG: transcriptional repressor [Bacillati bacterium ANGP1]|uniref:Transcriptional repressor n=1 Tax=Candidatus Segetimicrobium genomatis TaxID=2569760 RepID=A0A537LIV7_9BACT|nr:MAG: transcriptional repressor [Terrabacteria group bacterium ANGP1]